MTSVFVRENGGPEQLVLDDESARDPGPGEVGVRVAAAGVNFIDIYQRTGAYPMALPYVAGSEAAGTVHAIGDGVTDVAVGDHVAWAMVAGTGYTEHAVVPADRVVPVPEGVSDEVAAAEMLQGMTAHYLCDATYAVQPGDATLVHAGAGGVGLLLTQLVVHRGGRVISTVSTPEKATLSAQPAPPMCSTTTASPSAYGASPTERASPRSTTGSDRPPSRGAWTRCVRAECWRCSAPPAVRCRRWTRRCSTPRGRCS